MSDRALTREELLALPAAIDIVTAGRALGVGRTKAHELVRSGRWPTRVMRLGSIYRIPTAELLELLGLAPDMSEAPGHHPEAVATASESLGDPHDQRTTSTVRPARGRAS